VTHDQLKAIIERYTPTMRDVISPASLDEIARLEAVTGPLPESYRDFLAWMGNQCLFLDGEELAYSPVELLEIYEDPSDHIPDGFILFGIDKSGNSFDAHIRRLDGAVVRLSEYYNGVTNKDMMLESGSLTSYLLAAYVRKTLVPSHPFHFSAAVTGDGEQIRETWRILDEASSHFEIPYPIAFSDFRFYGGNDFVVGLHQPPQSAVVKIHFGALERTRYEPWYDLVFQRLRSLRMPV
jgi:hypothetical protein